MTWRSLIARAWRLFRHKKRHKKCLQNIVRMEQDLWPPPTLDAHVYSLNPGAIWPVKDVNDITIWHPNFTPALSMTSVFVDTRIAPKTRDSPIPGQLELGG